MFERAWRTGWFLTRRWTRKGLRASTRLQLPAPAVLPAAGAVVGLYGGLLAGIFANLIGLVSGVVALLASPRVTAPTGKGFLQRLLHELSARNFHFEFLVLAGLPALLLFLWARRLARRASSELFARRLKVLSLAALGALALYYPLVGLTVLSRVLRGGRALPEHLLHLPSWAMLVLPLVGGVLVGRLLRERPEAHGHGIPEVLKAVQREGEGLGARSGMLKILASAVTIGTGGSAGREGPIVYGAGALAAGVARTLGFSRRELTILLACGAGAGIAASFNAPVAGAVFALEIILREFELKVFSPIILASVTATLVGRGVMGSTQMLRRFPYEMVSGWEVIPYVGLGLLCGLLAFAFVWMLHKTEDYFNGRHRSRLSAWLGDRSLSFRAGLGGLIVGGMALLNPSVWGTGHHFSNLAAAGKLGLGFLLAAAVLKLVATSITIGSGGSGGTFFPAIFIGAMAGGAFGMWVHQLAPAHTAPSGAYALIGMGGVAAGLTRGPLTGMLMIYELTGNYQIILPLMICCALSSGLCHVLTERKGMHATGRDVLGQTAIRALMVPQRALAPELKASDSVDAILASGETALPAVDSAGRLVGIVQIHELHDIWQDETLVRSLTASDLTHKLPVLGPEEDLRTAIRVINREDVDVLPVLDADAPGTRTALITRAAIRRYLRAQTAAEHQTGRHAVVATEMEG